MNQSFMSAMEVAEELGVSKAYAYKVVRELNEELRSKGFQTVSGRINRIYFKERFYLAGKEVKKNVSIILQFGHSCLNNMIKSFLLS